MTGAGSTAVLTTVTHDAAGTRDLAAGLASCCGPGDVILLAGDLGAGKTTFAQGFGAALGITERMTSPTFTLVRQYPCDAGPVRLLLHADVYRLDSLNEVVDLGLGDPVEEGAVALVEWGDAVEPAMGGGSLTVRLEPVPGGGDDDRRVTLSAAGTRWDGRWAAIAVRLAPWAVPADGGTPAPPSAGAAGGPPAAGGRA